MPDADTPLTSALAPWPATPTTLPAPSRTSVPNTSAPSLPGSATSMAATSWRVGKRSATTAPARGMTCSTVDSS
ncbi:Uncharacterised protein [Bordetella pertussis]|nr:Uncharacterised protein [Bordetella pertussis]